MNKKVKLITATSLVSAGALALGAFAFFSDFSEKDVDSIAGTVDVNTSDFNFENPENINPGDNDPELPKDPNRPEGTSHKLTFTVSNKGSKSIRTKHEITIKMKDPTLDPSVFRIHNMEEKEVVKKYYKVNDAYITQEEYNALETENKFCTEVKYVVASDIFDGIGNSSEKETESSVKEENGICSKDYAYQLVMSQYATDKYQGAKVDINVATFAIQFRNTDASGWYKISSDNIEGQLG